MLGNKIASANIKRSLHSLISPTNFTPLSDHESGDCPISSYSSVVSPMTSLPKSLNNITPVHNRILSSADAQISSGNSTSLNGFISTNPSLILDASEMPTNAVINSTIIPPSSKQVEKVKTPGTTKRIRTMTTSCASRSSRMIAMNNQTPTDQGGLSARAKQHQKTLTVINENVNGRKPLAETHGNNSSMSNRSLYKGARFLVSPRYLDVSTPGCETMKGAGSSMRGLISPMIRSTRADFVGRVKTEISRIDPHNKEEGLFEQNPSLLNMNKRPQTVLEKKGKVEEKGGAAGISFTKFLQGGGYRAKLVGAATEENFGVKMFRPVKERVNNDKENRGGEERLMRSTGNLERLFTPRELHSIKNKN